MRKIDLLLNEYGESHQNATNKTIHWICVPLIFFSIVCLLWAIPSSLISAPFEGTAAEFANWATLLLLLTLIYYLVLSPPLFTGMFLFSALCVLGAWWIDHYLAMPIWVVALIIFVLAWIGQFYGHKVEGKKPSFFKDLQFLLIGPAWLMHFIFKKLGVRY